MLRSLNSQNILVSILIPCYNGEETIHRAITSAISQTYSNLEILIVNDGSTDNSLEIINNFISKDNRVRVISHKNKGLSITSNILIKNSVGLYFYFLHADDFIEFNTIEIMVLKTKNNEDLVFAKSFIGEKNKIFKFHSNINSNMTNKDLLMKVCTYTWGILYNRKFWNKYNFEYLNERAHLEDIIIVYVYSRARNIGVSNIALYHYTNDFSKKINKEKCEESMKQIKYLYSLLNLKKFDRGINDALVLIYSNTFYAFKFITNENRKTRKDLLKKLSYFYKLQPKLRMPKDIYRWFYFLFAKFL